MVEPNLINPFANKESTEWFVRFTNFTEIWEHHRSSLCHELDFFVGGLLTLIHALKTGGRYPYLWLAIFFHGIVVENVTYNLPDIDNFWHAQSTVVLLGGRLPLQIMFLYPTFLYTASVAVAHMRLPRYAEPFAVGVLTVLMDMPYDIMGIKLLWWTWHDTDPNIYDRFYWVPWASFYFHATFASSVTFFFELFRQLFVGKDRFDPKAGSFLREIPVCILTGILGMPGGVLQFIPLFHPLKDILGIHSENIVCVLLMGFAIIAWSCDRNPSTEARPTKDYRSRFGIIQLLVFFHYTLYIMVVIFAKPEEHIVVGLHEPTGPCNISTPVHTPIGQVLSKRTYFCTKDFEEPVFDWHCLQGGKPPADGLSWYTICGTPYPNKAEYVFVVTFICVFAMYIYYQLLMKSSPVGVVKQPKGKLKVN